MQNPSYYFEVRRALHCLDFKSSDWSRPVSKVMGFMTFLAACSIEDDCGLARYLQGTFAENLIMCPKRGATLERACSTVLYGVIDLFAPSEGNACVEAHSWQIPTTVVGGHNFIRSSNYVGIRFTPFPPPFQKYREGDFIDIKAFH